MFTAKVPTEGTKMNRDRAAIFWAVVAALAAMVATGNSQEKKEGDAAHKIVHYGELKWTPIIKGCDLAAVSGDSNAEGAPFVLRIRCADGTRVPAHWHPTDENLTVLKGTFLVGMGETYDENKLQTMNVGNFILMPKEMRHFAMNKGEVIVQIHGTGPFKVNWVNPADVIPPDKPPAGEKPKS
jgi:quercetin dioxygenase-like cupin family protein